MSNAIPSLKRFADKTADEVFKSDLNVEGSNVRLGRNAIGNVNLWFWDKASDIYRALFYDNTLGLLGVQTRAGGGFIPHSGLIGNSVGQYVLARQIDGVARGFNHLVPGSSLRPSDCNAYHQAVVLGGTWRCLGRVNAGTDQEFGAVATLWQRVS